MIPVSGALAPAALAATHRVGPDMTMAEWQIADGRLFTAARRHTSDTLATHALALTGGGSAERWRVVRSAAGRPEGHGDAGGREPISLSATDRVRAVLVGSSGEVGLDIETLPRVARNTRPDDEWLSDRERALLATLDAGDQLVEIACRWTLREACGKALGLGLAAWATPPVFTLRSGRIALDDARARDWAIGLYRADELLLATARIG